MAKHSKVLLTGASGFVAAHILDILIKRNYNVVATVRDQEKADYIYQKYPDYKSQIQVVLVPDIQPADAFDEVLSTYKDITAVIHTASPFFPAKADPVNELLNPAIKGTTNVLNSIKKHAPQVAHVVITSSFAAIVNPDKQRDHTFTFSEKVWNPVTYEEAATDLAKSYRGSKTIAEQTFWKFIEEENPNFVGTTVNPPLVLGPVIHKVKSPQALNTSTQAVYNLLHTKPGENAHVDSPYGLWVDVRDTALAHVLAIEQPEAPGKRWFITPGYFQGQEVLDVIYKHFPELNGKIASGTPLAEEQIEQDLLTYAQVDTSVTVKESGLKYTDFETCIVDTVNSLLEYNTKWGVSH